MGVRSLGREDPLDEGMAHPVFLPGESQGPLSMGFSRHGSSSILAWRIPWTEDPGGLWSIGSQRLGHDRSDLARVHGDYLP